MKRFMKLLFVSLCFCISAATVVESIPAEKTMIQAATKKVALNKSSLTLIKGSSYTLKLSNNKKTIKWSSSNSKIASVSSKGSVKAIKNGTVKIYAKVSGKTYTCKVKVETPYISKKAVSIYKGKTYKLSMKANTQKVKWSSSNTKIAKVSSTGNVTGVKAGKTTIKATIGTKKYTSTITVKNPSFTLNTSSITLNKGKTYTVKPKMAPSAKITWKSSNSAIASVSTKGVITAKKGGSAVITAKANGITRSIKVKVNAQTFTLDRSKATLGLGDKIYVSGKVSPYAKVTWKSSNPKVASVSGSGTYVTIYAKGKGSAKITATANGITRTIAVTVTNPYFTINKTSISVPYGKSAKLGISASPKPSYISWTTTSNQRVASINSNGTINPFAVGTATYTAKVNGITRSVKVTVTNPTSSTYHDGWYKVGINIPAGEYLLTPTNRFLPSYTIYEDASYNKTVKVTQFPGNTNGGVGNGFVTLKNGQYIQLTSCTALKAPSKITVNGPGTYRVGKDLGPGTYVINKLKPTSNEYKDTASYYVYENSYFNDYPYAGKYNLNSETVNLNSGDVIVIANARINKK